MTTHYTAETAAFDRTFDEDRISDNEDRVIDLILHTTAGLGVDAQKALLFGLGHMVIHEDYGGIPDIGDEHMESLGVIKEFAEWVFKTVESHLVCNRNDCTLSLDDISIEDKELILAATKWILDNHGKARHYTDIAEGIGYDGDSNDIDRVLTWFIQYRHQSHH